MPFFNQSVINESTTDDLPRCHEPSTSIEVFFMVSYSLVFLVGLLLNGFILKFLLCQRQKSSRSIMIYLKNLIAADFLLSLCLPFDIINGASNSMTIRVIYCNFGSTMFYLNMYTSILFMTYIAYNRYLKIIYSNKTHIIQTVQGACIISTLTWICTLTIVTSYVSSSLITQRNLTFIPSSCEELRSTNFNVFDIVFDTCVLVIFLYILALIIFVYNRTSHKVSEVQQSQLTSSSSKKLAKSRRNMRVLVSVFCISFTPYQLVNIFYDILGCSWSPVLNFLQEVTRVLSAVNICLDPFIYFIFCKDFREQLRLKNGFFLRRDTPELNMERGPQNETEPNIQFSSESS
ncbi:P2Y purinoceptor 14-like [Sphaeramia orbicularis]|uniref:P2Y purinoceptor 14-like n=1 Tax=Sphaeramia orbicularis TaxID=375764 RepID=UPI00117F1011|nr:P2Y purinoceptor 14-like [Sphaeramia orbicularis]